MCFCTFENLDLKLRDTVVYWSGVVLILFVNLLSKVVVAEQKIPHKHGRLQTEEAPWWLCEWSLSCTKTFTELSIIKDPPPWFQSSLFMS